MAKKESLQSAENLEAVDVLSEKKSRRSWELLIMIKMLLMKLQKSPDYRQNTFRKMQNYLRKKGCLHMHLPDVTSQEDLWRIWYMRRREKLF